MIAWMYCVGEGWRSCEDATMSKSLPVASLFCWFCKYEVHELVYFLTFRKNGIMFCFVLFCSFGKRSESFLFEWSTFLFLVQKHWYVKFLRWVGWWGEGWVGWTAKRTTSRTCFLYISDKKGTFHFHFSDKIHIKRNFLKKGTKWQSLVNCRVGGMWYVPLAKEVDFVLGFIKAWQTSEKREKLPCLGRCKTTI